MAKSKETGDMARLRSAVLRSVVLVIAVAASVGSSGARASEQRALLVVGKPYSTDARTVTLVERDGRRLRIPRNRVPDWVPLSASRWVRFMADRKAITYLAPIR